MNLVNGILITGGSADLFTNDSKLCEYKKLLNPNIVCPSKYMQMVDFIVKKATSLSKNGKPFPIWGTCLGYEALLISLSKFTLKKSPIPSENHSLNLNLNPDKIEFFENFLGKDLTKEIQTQPYIYFNHHYAFTPSQISDNKYLRDIVEILSTTKLENNQIIVSMIKHKKYPFFGA